MKRIADKEIPPQLEQQRQEKSPRRRPVRELSLLVASTGNSVFIRLMDWVKSSPSFQPHLQRFNHLGDNGLPDAAREVLTMLHGSAPVVWDGDREKTQEILSQHPFLLVTNHHHTTEPLPIFANLPSRDSILAIGNSRITKTIAPPSVHRHFVDVLPPLAFERKEERQRRQTANREAVSQVGQRLAQENIGVFIAPQGDLKTGWRTGIARLAEEVLDRNDVYFVMSYVEGNRPMIWEIARRRGFKRCVHFSEAIPFSQLPIPDEVKALPTGNPEKLTKITLAMEQYYSAWVDTIKTK